MPQQAPEHRIPLPKAASFISMMELAVRNGDERLVEKAAPLLQDLTDRIQREVYELSELQYRACCLRDQCAAQAGPVAASGDRP
jgi:hypothetical protein